MIKIIKKQDIEDLKVSNHLSEPYLTYLEEYFLQLWEALSDGEDERTFSLERDGYIVVLEPDDDLKDLREVGLNPADGGLLASWPGPEYVEKLILDDGMEIYRIFYLYDNNYGMTFFSLKGQFNEEVEHWLEEQCLSGNSH